MSEVSVTELWVEPIEQSEEEQTPPQNEIPLDIRISYADKYWAELGRMTAGQLALNLGTNDRWVHRLVDELGIPSSVDFPDASGHPTYPDFTMGVLDDELTWRLDYKEMPRFVTPRFIADTFGQSRQWVHESLAEIENLKIYTISQKVTKRKTPHYSKIVMNKLRPIAMKYPLDNDWPTRKDLAEQVGMPLSWVSEQLELGGYQSVERKSQASGKILLYEMPEALEFLRLRKLERPKPAGDWMSEMYIAERLGRSIAWVKARLPAFEDQAEIRLDDYERPKIHYPPAICDALQRQVEEETRELEAKMRHKAWVQSLPDSEGHLTLEQVADWMGETPEETEARLEEYSIEPTSMWRARGGNVVEGYSVEDITTIKNIERNAIHYTLDAQNVVGSLRSRIRLREQAIEGLELFGADESNEQVQRLEQELGRLGSMYIAALEIRDFYEDNAYETPVDEYDDL